MCAREGEADACFLGAEADKKAAQALRRDTNAILEWYAEGGRNMHTRKAIIALFMATLAFAVSFAIWSLLSPLASQFQKLYHMGDFAISVLIAVPVLLGSLARIPMGLLTDRYGGRRVMTLLLLFTIISCIGFYFARSYWTFLFWALALSWRPY
jgi:nitrate/nitrite transporter NarK